MRTINYSQRTCQKCGRMFIPTSSTQLWCVECLTKRCEVCGKPITARNKSTFDKVRYCSLECKHIGWTREHQGKNAPNYKNGSRSETIDVVCSVCGKQISRQKCQAEKWDIHFCSGACRGKWQSEHRTGENNPKYSRVTKACEMCGKRFEAWPCIERDTRFCSKECRNDWQSTRMMGENHYNWHGGVTNWKSSMMAKREYKEWRETVLNRDGRKCTECGTTSNLHAHHIIGVQEAPDLIYDVSNGKTLCKHCHMKAHRKKDIQSEPHK